MELQQSFCERTGRQTSFTRLIRTFRSLIFYLSTAPDSALWSVPFNDHECWYIECNLYATSRRGAAEDATRSGLAHNTRTGTLRRTRPLLSTLPAHCAEPARTIDAGKHTSILNYRRIDEISTLMHRTQPIYSAFYTIAWLLRTI